MRKCTRNEVLATRSTEAIKLNQSNFNSSALSVIAPITHIRTEKPSIIADSGANVTCYTARDSDKLSDIQNNTDHTVFMPNSGTITSSGVGIIPVPPESDLRPIKALIFPDSQLQRSLISLADYCNQGCTATLTATNITVTKNNKIVAQGNKEHNAKLWPLIPSPEPTCNDPIAEVNHVITHQYNADFVDFWHKTLGSPPVSTLSKAVSMGWLSHIPRLTLRMITQNPPQHIATARGHLNLNRQGQRSTQPISTSGNRDTADVHNLELEDSSSSNDAPEEDNNVYIKVHDAAEYSTTNHIDLTGRFPVQSRSGNNHMLISVYNKYIHCEPMKNREASQYVNAVKATISFLRRQGHNPNVQRMDNETSATLEAYLETENMTVEYVPAADHRQNRAERAIQTWKNHFISTLATADKEFPLAAWDKIIEQVEIGTNILRPYGPDPTKSAWEGIHGKKFDFMRNPMAPVGTRVLIYESPNIRQSWAAHGVDGFYIGPALQHYRCFRTMPITTLSERITNTVAWLPAAFKMPGSDPHALLQTAISDLANALQQVARSGFTQDFNQPQLQVVQQSLQHVANLYNPYMPPIGPASPTPPVDTAAQRVPATLPAPVTTAAQRVIPEETANTAPDATPSTTPAAADNMVPRPHASRMHRNTGPTSLELATRVAVPMTHEEVNHVQVHEYHTWQHDMHRAERVMQEALQAHAVEELVGINSENITATEYMAGALEEMEDAEATLQPAPSSYAAAMKSQQPEVKEQWEAAAHREFVRLVEETGTMEFIHHSEKPAEKKATYYNPQLKNKIVDGQVLHRVRGTAGGDKVEYMGDVRAATADMPTVKILLNAVVSEDAHWMTADIKDFYLGTPMDIPEYMRVQRKHIPSATQDYFNLKEKFANDSVMVKINKGMYGLPQAGKLAQQRLIKHLAEHGYEQCKNTPCLFRHRSRAIAFTLVVDDFGIKYKHKEDAQHLIAALQSLYILKVNWEGDRYLGFKIDHERNERKISISIPYYVERALKRFGVERTPRSTNSPGIHIPPKYGKRTQEAAPIDISAPLDEAETNRIQQIVGVFLYYARAVDPTMRVQTSRIGSAAATPTEDVKKETQRLLQYAACWPNAKITYRASDMRLIVHSDAGHLAEPRSRSRAGGIHWLGNHGDDGITSNNGSVEVVCTILPSVVQAAAEAEYGALFLNGQAAEPLRNTLSDLGYPQQATLIVADNTTAVGITHQNVKQRKSQAFDMRYHWIRDRQAQGHFNVIWHKGSINLADFFTKTHPSSTFMAKRNLYIEDQVPTNRPETATTRRQKKKREKQEAAAAVVLKGVLTQ